MAAGIDIIDYATGKQYMINCSTMVVPIRLLNERLIFEVT